MQISVYHLLTFYIQILKGKLQILCIMRYVKGGGAGELIIWSPITQVMLLLIQIGSICMKQHFSERIIDPAPPPFLFGRGGGGRREQGYVGDKQSESRYLAQKCNKILSHLVQQQPKRKTKFTGSVKPTVSPTLAAHQTIRYENIAIQTMLPRNVNGYSFLFSWKWKTENMYFELFEGFKLKRYISIKPR